MCSRVFLLAPFITAVAMTGALAASAQAMIETWRVIDNGSAAAVSEQSSARAGGGDGHPVFAARMSGSDIMSAAEHSSAKVASIWSKTFVGGNLANAHAFC